MKTQSFYGLFFLFFSMVSAEEEGFLLISKPIEKNEVHNNFEIDGDLKLDIESNSNVNQLPDGQVLSSEKSGSHIVSTLNWSIKNKNKTKDQRADVWSWGGSLGKMKFFSSAFRSRESENLTFGPSIQKKYGSHSRRVGSTTKFQLRHDWLQSTGQRSLGFRTITFGQINIFKPKKSIWGYDVMIPVLGTDLEFRDFLNSLAKDASGKSMDTLTPQLLFLTIAMKKKVQFKHKSTVMGLARLTFSDAANQEYLDVRLSVRHSIRKSNLEGELGAGWIHRIQDEYNGLSRRDERYEVTLSFQSYWKKDRHLVRIYSAYEDQASDFSSFTYENRKLGVSLMAKF